MSGGRVFKVISKHQKFESPFEVSTQSNRPERFEDYCQEKYSRDKQENEGKEHRN